MKFLGYVEMLIMGIIIYTTAQVWNTLALAADEGVDSVVPGNEIFTEANLHAPIQYAGVLRGSDIPQFCIARQMKFAQDIPQEEIDPSTLYVCVLFNNPFVNSALRVCTHDFRAEFIPKNQTCTLPQKLQKEGSSCMPLCMSPAHVSAIPPGQSTMFFIPIVSTKDVVEVHDRVSLSGFIGVCEMLPGSLSQALRGGEIYSIPVIETFEYQEGPRIELEDGRNKSVDASLLIKMEGDETYGKLLMENNTDRCIRTDYYIWHELDGAYDVSLKFPRAEENVARFELPSSQADRNRLFRNPLVLFPGEKWKSSDWQKLEVDVETVMDDEGRCHYLTRQFMLGSFLDWDKLELEAAHARLQSVEEVKKNLPHAKHMREKNDYSLKNSNM